MTRTGLAGFALVALLFVSSCAQVLGIGNPVTCTDGTEYCAVETDTGTDGFCADLTRDPENCGACGKSCKGASCVDGLCVDTDCSQEFAQCSTPGESSVECHGLDCVEFAAVTHPVCLRRCRTTDDCPYDYFCAPAADSAYASGFYQFVLTAGHCVPSFCNGPSGSWYENGTANAQCEVGGDAYLTAGAVNGRSGTCIVTGSNGVGVCVEQGSVQTSGTCTFQPGGCVERTSYLACKQGDVCLGTSGTPQGTCYQACDPKAVLSTCPSGMTCKDHSGGLKVLGACEY